MRKKSASTRERSSYNMCGPVSSLCPERGFAGLSAGYYVGLIWDTVIVQQLYVPMFMSGFYWMNFADISLYKKKLREIIFHDLNIIKEKEDKY